MERSNLFSFEPCHTWLWFIDNEQRHHQIGIELFLINFELNEYYQIRCDSHDNLQAEWEIFVCVYFPIIKLQYTYSIVQRIVPDK